MPYYPPSSGGGGGDGITESAADAKYAQLALSNYLSAHQTIVNDDTESSALSVYGVEGQLNNIFDVRDNNSNFLLAVDPNGSTTMNDINVSHVLASTFNAAGFTTYSLYENPIQAQYYSHAVVTDPGSYTGQSLTLSAAYLKNEITLTDPIDANWANWTTISSYTDITPDSLYTLTNFNGLYMATYNNADLDSSIFVNNITADIYWSAGGASSLTSVLALVEAQSGKELGDLIGLASSVGNYGSGSAAARYGLKIEGDNSQGPIDNSYQLYLGDATQSSANNKWAIWTDGGEVRHRTGSAGTQGVVIQAAPSQSADLLKILSSDGVTAMSRINKSGYFVTLDNGEPADEDLNNGEVVLWFNSSTGSLSVKGKNDVGTVVTGEIVLT